MVERLAEDKRRGWQRTRVKTDINRDKRLANDKRRRDWQKKRREAGRGRD